jgi:hypothetical protein
MKKSDPKPRPPEVDPDEGTEPDGTPVENRSGRRDAEPALLDAA